MDLVIKLEIIIVIRDRLLAFTLIIIYNIYNKPFFFKEDLNFFVHNSDNNFLEFNDFVLEKLIILSVT